MGIASITYDEESQNLINLRNRGAMMSDPSIREGYVQTTIAEGLKNAGSNDSGAMAGFMGMGMGMQMGGGFMGAASNTNMQQMQMNQAPGQMPGTQLGSAWTCPGCGTSNTGKFCGECGHPRPDTPWTCACGNINTGKFCSDCGKPRP